MSLILNIRMSTAAHQSQMSIDELVRARAHAHVRVIKYINALDSRPVTADLSCWAYWTGWACWTGCMAPPNATIMWLGVTRCLSPPFEGPHFIFFVFFIFYQHANVRLGSVLNSVASLFSQSVCIREARREGARRWRWGRAPDRWPPSGGLLQRLKS